MRIVIIGAVAAGTSAAAKARRNNEEAEIVVYEKDSFISYSSCGMPYYLGGELQSENVLVPRNPSFFKNKYNVDIYTSHEVTSIDPVAKRISITNLTTGEAFEECYDKLVLATGAYAVIPTINGINLDHVFTLRNINDMNKIKDFIDRKQPKSAVIVGTGFIGLEVCENLNKLGIKVTMIEKLQQVTPGLDKDMAVYVEDYIVSKGITVIKGSTVDEINEGAIVIEDKLIEADLVILSVGVKPNTELAKQIGIELGETGAIKVNNRMETNIVDIYACGDCIEEFHLITGKPVYRPMGSTANKTGRIVGDSITGGSLEFRGILGTGIFKVFDMSVAQTGLSEREALQQGFDIVVCHNIKPNKPEYMGGKEMVIKAIAEKSSGKLLGVQIVGYEGVDKRIDVFVTALTFKAKAEDLFHLDLAYAPPFSTTKDPVMYTGMILENAIHAGRPLITEDQLDKLMASGVNYNLIDARIVEQYTQGHVENARNIPHTQLRDAADALDPNVIAITYCNKGVTGNAAQNILLGKGVTKVYNLSGGHKHYKKNH